MSSADRPVGNDRCAIARRALLLAVPGVVLVMIRRRASAQPKPKPLEIRPQWASVAPGDVIDFVAAGGSGTGYRWELGTNRSGATLDASTGRYVAGNRAEGHDLIKVTDSNGGVAFVGINLLPPLALPANFSRSPLIVAPRQALDLPLPADGEWKILKNRSRAHLDGAFRYVAGIEGDCDDELEISAYRQKARIVVHVGPQIRIVNAIGAIKVGATRALKATGGSGVDLRWSIMRNASGGSINATTGVYVAGLTSGVDIVDVRDSLGNTTAAMITVGAGDSRG